MWYPLLFIIMAYVKPCVSKFQIEHESKTYLHKGNEIMSDTHLESINISFEDAIYNRNYTVSELANTSLKNPTGIGYTIQFQCSEVIETSQCYYFIDSPYN